MTDTGVGYNPNDNNAEQDFMDEPALRFVAPLVEGRPPAARGVPVRAEAAGAAGGGAGDFWP